MSPEALGLVMIVLMVIAILIGFPTAFTLMALGVTFGFLGIGFVVFDLVVQRTFFVMQNDVLVAIPLFLFMGYIIERSGILDELFHALQVLLGWLPGSPWPHC
jgi:TRAP-type mannitol/chloroaromatic compound transport system permease large subunit